MSPQSPKKAKKRAEGANSNVFSMFEQAQIQEFKEAFTIMDQNRDGFIDKSDLRDTFAALGRVNVKQEEIDEMLKEAPGPVNFTVFLTMFGEKLKGADPEETILNAFKVFDPEATGILKKDYVTDMLTTQADRFSPEESPKKAKKRAEGANSNVFSMFEQAQIQEFKEAFTIMDQNRDGFIDKSDLRDTFAALGRVNVKQEEIDEMLKEAPGPVNFTVFLTMFGEKLKGADPEETILNAFKVFDPEATGILKKDYVTDMLTTQADRFSPEEMEQMFLAFPPDVAGNLDYKNLVYIITHGEDKDQE
ncbi:Myosin regulatory light chain 2, ventricular/cardiac muscle isoform [Acipenser ruthenus]|uniref:Myosin regulatory light chain 2, ventricular/cardiac muscle isoform n=1 Tax=Acipenser ruthenus TaxID=7906 RepID=A0A444UYC4_ACIRT|nr:Myosin regulatory light chain 2, ventricular/cardiac muscle isoform [Acipenser ruthenus]